MAVDKKPAETVPVATDIVVQISENTEARGGAESTNNTHISASCVPITTDTGTNHLITRNDRMGNSMQTKYGWCRDWRTGSTVPSDHYNNDAVRSNNSALHRW